MAENKNIGTSERVRFLFFVYILSRFSSMEKILTLLTIILLTFISLFIIFHLCQEIYFGASSRAWDGSGHQAIAQIYSNSIFPDSFGWSYAYFGGMPFPNFYPPVFYWLVGLLSQKLFAI